MKAIQCREFGPPESLVLADLPEPVAGPGEVIVEMKAMGVNFTDLLASEGRSQLKRHLPITPGSEGAGIVRSVGPGVSDLAVGTRVLGICVHGAFAEQVRFRREEVAPIPDDMDFDTAAVIYVASMTARYGLVDKGALQAGESLLVLGAGSGAGLAAIDIGLALGANVVAAASSEAKLALAAERGARELVRYESGILDLAGQKRFLADLRAAAARIRPLAPHQLGDLHGTREGGFDVIYDVVGGSYAEPALRALGWRGRYLSIGFAGGVPLVSLGPLLFKDACIFGVEPADEKDRLPGLNHAAMRDIFEWHRKGFLVPQITATYLLAEVPRALRDLKERKATGRILIRP